jgi:hypothetical protein
MRCEQTSTRSADYLSGTLDAAERVELEEHLQGCEACRNELAGLSSLWQRLDDVRADQPDSHEMRARFDAMLAEQSREMRGEPLSPLASVSPGPSRQSGAPRPRRRRTFHPFLQACAAALLVVAGIQVGRQLTAPAITSPDVTALRQEVRDLRQMVTLSLMQQQSASERLKGVSWSNQLDRPGNEVVAALIDTLMHDANVNVRLASIDALKRFAERDAVRTATLHALDTQTSPLVQMALIDFVVETRERDAIESLRRLSRDEQVNEVVRARASWGIDHLEAA